MSGAETSSGPQDLLVRCKELPWHQLGPGTYFKLLRVSEETGVWTSLVKMEAGSRFAPHKHLGAAEFFVVKGAFEYRGGAARAGDYGYEPLGAVHGATTCTEESEYIITTYGPIAFLNEDGSIQMVYDFAAAKQLWDEQQAGRSGSLKLSVEVQPGRQGY
ncbi:MAG: 2,4'-dihydroxyacetophenone dioxygenase family protein [Candidatus Binatia bacterium]